MTIQLNVPKFADADALAAKINNADDIRKSVYYHNAQEEDIELTMSCDKGEAKMQLKNFMEAAIWQGIRCRDGRNNQLRAEYLAAYDLYKSIERSK